MDKVLERDAYLCSSRSVDEYVVHGGAALDVAECFVCCNAAACGDAARTTKRTPQEQSSTAQTSSLCVRTAFVGKAVLTVLLC